MQTNLNPTDGKPDAADPIDRISCKMNFEGLVYPGVSALVNPTKDWPAVFLACSADDRADIAGPVARGSSTTRPAAQGLADVYLRYKVPLAFLPNCTSTRPAATASARATAPSKRPVGWTVCCCG